MANEKYSARQTIGKAGEEAAIAFYEGRGYKLVERNWRAGRFAEVDLIFRCRQQLLVFCEVKTRRLLTNSMDAAGTGFDSVGWRKQRKIITAARIYTARHALVDMPCRFDVLVISMSLPGAGSATPSAPDAVIIHVPDAFSA